MSENFEVSPEVDPGTEEYEKQVSKERDGILVDTLVAKIGELSREQCNRLARTLEAAFLVSIRKDDLNSKKRDIQDRFRQSADTRTYDQNVMERTRREFETGKARLQELIGASAEFLPEGADSDFFSSLGHEDRKKIDGTLKSRQFEVGT